MKVAIASKNPIKAAAAKEAFQAFFPDEQFKFIIIEAASEVSDQPLYESETIKGAQNRAEFALAATGADFGVGIEGGQSKINGHWYTGNIAAVATRNNQTGIGFGHRVATPNPIQQQIKTGKNLNDAVGQTHGVKDAGKKEGLIGILSHGLITRGSSSRDAVILALASISRNA